MSIVDSHVICSYSVLCCLFICDLDVRLCHKLTPDCIHLIHALT